MALVVDAISTVSKTLNSVTYFSKGRLNIDLLQEVVNDLDEIEIISIIFLMTDKDTDFSQVIELLKKDSSTKLTELSNRNGWEEKLLEILMIIGNINVIKKLGFNAHEIEAMTQRFLCTAECHNVTPNLNKVIKSLYFLCEYLTKIEVRKLIEETNKTLNSHVDLDEDKMWLELHILHWLDQKYITIDQDNPNLNKLVSNLKNIGCLIDLPFNFEDWRNTNKNQQDSSQALENDNSLQFTSNSQCNKINNNSVNGRISWMKEHKRLCIIINEINFQNKLRYKTREGSSMDEQNLEKTFEGCNFKIKKYQDLTKSDMMDLLNSFNEESYNDYGCIFMCILSHGYDGEVVFSDDKTISIDTIRKKFCCQKLQNVFKFIILQSCQGQQIGMVDYNSRLTTDGPTKDLNPFVFKHFGLFQATISKFAALRDETEGSWFIQDVCTEIRVSTPIVVTEWVSRVTKRVSNRNAKYEDKEIVQLPYFSGSTPDNYLLPTYCEK